MHFLALFHTAILIQPPPLRGTSFHRKEGASTRAPSLGRGCRAQRGGVGFLWGGEAASSLPSQRGEGFISGIAASPYRSLPHWGRGTASAVDRVLSYNACLRRIFHLFQLSFMPLEPYPARYARHLPHEGKADDARETCCQEIFGHRPIYICGEAATTTLNPEP